MQGESMDKLSQILSEKRKALTEGGEDEVSPEAEEEFERNTQINAKLKTSLATAKEKKKIMLEETRETAHDSEGLKKQAAELKQKAGELDRQIEEAEAALQSQAEAAEREEQQQVQSPPMNAVAQAIQPELDAYDLEGDEAAASGPKPFSPGLPSGSPPLSAERDDVIAKTTNMSPAPVSAASASPSPPQNAAGQSPPTATAAGASPQQTEPATPESRYKGCLTSTNAVWHEDNLATIRLARSVNVPMRSAAYKVIFENKQSEGTLHVQKFEMVSYDNKGNDCKMRSGGSTEDNDRQGTEVDRAEVQQIGRPPHRSRVLLLSLQCVRHRLRVSGR